MKYDAEYFIRKFTAIPASRWIVKDYKRGNRCCAYGHCGMGHGKPEPKESLKLAELSRRMMKIRDTMGVSLANDGFDANYQQANPKQRVLAWLRDAKKAGL